MSAEAQAYSNSAGQRRETREHGAGAAAHKTNRTTSKVRRILAGAPQLEATPYPQWTAAIGIMSRMLGTTIIVFGYMTWKAAQKQFDPAQLHFWQSYWYNRAWARGAFIVAVGHLLCWLTQSLTSAAVLAGFSCWAICMAIVMGYVYFREAVTAKLLVGHGCLVVGCICVSAAGPTDYSQHNVQKFMAAWSQKAFLYLVIGTLCILLPSGTPLVPCWGQFRTEISQSSPFRLSTCAAILSWYVVLLLRSAAVFLWDDAWNIPKHMRYWQWGFLLIAAICAACAVHFLNMSLKLGKAVAVVPVFQALELLGRAVVPSIFFGNLSHLTAARHAFLWCSVICIGCGVLLVSQDSNIDTSDASSWQSAVGVMGQSKHGSHEVSKLNWQPRFPEPPESTANA